MPDPLIEQIKWRVRQPERSTSMSAKFGAPETIYAPVTSAQLEAAEVEIGFRLPDLVRDLYLEVGNGGFGPGYGIIGLEGGYRIYNWTLVESCAIFRDLKRYLRESGDEIPDWDWGAQWITYGYWGCNVTTVLDCGDPALPIYSLDALDLKPHTSKTLRQWWQDWLDGTIKQY